MRMNSLRLTPTPCPHCGAILNGAFSLQHDEPIVPKPGSAALCVMCGGVNKYDQEMNLQPVSLEEWATIIRNPMALATITLFQMFVYGRGPLQQHSSYQTYAA